MSNREKIIKGLEETEIVLAQAVDRGGEMAVMGAFKCLNHVTDALALLKKQEAKPIIHCKGCKYGLYSGTEYLCDKHSGHENRLGEDQYYKEWHNGSWFCADGERRDDDG